MASPLDTKISPIVEARECYSKGNYQKTKEICKKILTEQSTNIEAMKLLGFCRLKLNNFREAVNDLEKALKLEKSSQEICLILTKLYEACFYDNLFDKSILYARRLLALVTDRSTQAQILINIARIYLKMGKYEHAISECNTVLQFDSSNKKAADIRDKALKLKMTPQNEAHLASLASATSGSTTASSTASTGTLSSANNSAPQPLNQSDPDDSCSQHHAAP